MQECSTLISLDSRETGINNQLVNLHIALCAARMVNATCVHMADLGYRHGGAHHHGPLVRTPAAAPLMDLLRFNDEASGMLMCGARCAASGTVQTGRCRPGEACVDCHPYVGSRVTCLRRGLDRGSRVFLGTQVDDPLAKRCNGTQLGDLVGVTRLVDDYTVGLRMRLGNLTNHEYDVAQYRAGWDWRQHTAKVGQPWACYGPGTINSTLRTLTQPAPLRPLVMLTNAASAEPVPHLRNASVPLRVVSELVLASRARTVLLNPLSTAQHTIRKLAAPAAAGGPRIKVVRDGRHVIDQCECAAQDEDSRHWRRHTSICANYSSASGSGTVRGFPVREFGHVF